MKRGLDTLDPLPPLGPLAQPKPPEKPAEEEKPLLDLPPLWFGNVPTGKSWKAS